MTDEELAAIEERRAYWDGRAACDDCACMDDIPALVAEVRRLRGLRETMHVMREGIVEVSIDDKYHNLQVTVRDP